MDVIKDIGYRCNQEYWWTVRRRNCGTCLYSMWLNLTTSLYQKPNRDIVYNQEYYMTAVCVDKKLNAQPIICSAEPHHSRHFPISALLKNISAPFLFISRLWVLLHKYSQSAEFSNCPSLISTLFLLSVSCQSKIYIFPMTGYILN